MKGANMTQPMTVMVSSNMSIKQIGFALNTLNIILAELQNSICNLRIEEEIENAKEMVESPARSAIKKA